MACRAIRGVRIGMARAPLRLSAATPPIPFARVLLGAPDIRPATVAAVSPAHIQSRGKATAAAVGNSTSLPDFTNSELAFASKSTWEILRAWGVFKTCSFNWIVERCDVLYGFALRVFGNTLVHGIVRRTFFAHFCAGEDTADIKPRIDSLKQQGVGSILDYAAEAHIAAASGGDAPDQADSTPTGVKSARVYNIMSEEDADENANVFERAVIAVKDTNPEGFAAVKISALGDPKLLENVSTALVEIRTFFKRLKNLDEPFTNATDIEHDYLHTLSYDEFLTGWKFFFNSDEVSARAAFDRIDTNQSGSIDFMDFTYSLTPREIATLVEGCRTQGPLFQSALNAKELDLMDNVYRRAHRIVKLAKEHGVRVMIDAEWLAVQPCIDQIAINLQREFNTTTPIVFNTYQTYLKRTYREVRQDIARSQREAWAFGAKVVRGAYMVSERARAEELGIPDPVWSNYEETSACFNQVTSEILELIVQVWGTEKPKPEMMVASHNRHSVDMVCRRINKHGLPPACGVYFGQLLGMSDHITMTLGGMGYRAYKYVPYGPIDKVMPYLIRRTQENSTFLGSPGVQEERKMLGDECTRRLNPFKSKSKVASPHLAGA